jgi:hypothetical protein
MNFSGYGRHAGMQAKDDPRAAPQTFEGQFFCEAGVRVSAAPGAEIGLNRHVIAL